ncbi:MAG: hypothetical protein O2798_02655 [Chloroflexi bacterium]|nr:hypothetical protein [Chloroflexota bacterium]
MTRTRILVVLLVILIAVPLALVLFWHPEPGVVAPVPSEVHTVRTLAPGDSVTLADGRTIGFIEVLEDSRCPSDVTCIWMGLAVIVVDVTPAGGTSERFEFSLGTDDPTTVTGGALDQVTLGLDPYPVSTRPIEPGEYRLTVRID